MAEACQSTRRYVYVFNISLGRKGEEDDAFTTIMEETKNAVIA